MCNIAGYVGTRPAAPILIEMMRKEEGWDAGFYTGITTIHEGKLHYDKVIGDLDRLLSLTDAANFPGTVGFLHSRSKSGGDIRYGQPFISTDGRISYIANGYGGAFKGTMEESRKKEIEELTARGYQFSSRAEEAVSSYPILPDGSCAHASDIMCQSISKNTADGLDTPAAMEKSFCALPSEVIGLVLNLDEPDCICWARTNFPMFVGHASHGMYLATTPQAFPEDAQSITLLNAMSCGRVYRDRIEERFFTNPPGTVAPITPRVMHDCYEAICKGLQEGEKDHDQLCEIVKPFFDEAFCAPDSPVVYWVESELIRQGKLQVNTYRIPGVGDLTAPKFKASWK